MSIGARALAGLAEPSGWKEMWAAKEVGQIGVGLGKWEVGW